MLKLYKKDKFTYKNDKIHKNGCCDYVQKYKKLECLCLEEGGVGMGGWLQFRRGEVGWGRRSRNRGRECWQSGYIMTFTDGITDRHVLSVYLSVIPPVKVPRHYTAIPV